MVAAEPRSDTPVYTSHQVLLITGLSYRQFDYLMAVLRGHQTGSGRQRHFSWDDLLDVAKYAALLDYGITPRRAWHMVKHDDEAGETAPRVVSLCVDWELLAQQIEVKLGLRDSVP